MIVLLNGAFGIGKTTVAGLVVRRLPGALLYDPELLGFVLQRGARLFGRRVVDFQDLAAWRRLTIVALRLLRRFRRTIIVPMAFSNAQYLQEIRDGVARFEPAQLHACLIAPVDVVQQRRQTRRITAEDEAWQARRAAECCVAHRAEAFAIHVDAERPPEDIADEIVRLIVAAH